MIFPAVHALACYAQHLTLLNSVWGLQTDSCCQVNFAECGRPTVMQDSTRYEKTAKLLESYDPDYVPPTPRKQQQQQALRTAYIPGAAKPPATPAAVRCPTYDHFAPDMHQPLNCRQ